MTCRTTLHHRGPDECGPSPQSISRGARAGQPRADRARRGGAATRAPPAPPPPTTVPRPLAPGHGVAGAAAALGVQLAVAGAHCGRYGGVPGDASADTRWYVRRAALATLLPPIELHWIAGAHEEADGGIEKVEDAYSDFRTWRFAERLLGDDAPFMRAWHTSALEVEEMTAGEGAAFSQAMRIRGERWRRRSPGRRGRGFVRCNRRRRDHLSRDREGRRV
eukprot:ctg_2058.g527